MSSPAVARLTTVLTPLLTASGFDLEDLSVTSAGRRSVVRVVVDTDAGITLDDVAEVSRTVSDALDALDEAEPDVLGAAYVLEVTSPGVDRPLTLPRHWRRNLGRLVHVVRREGGEVSGRVQAADETEGGGVTLDVEGHQEEVPYATIARASVQVEFSRRDTAQLPGEDDA